MSQSSRRPPNHRALLVLARAVHFRNLSSASGQVGLSQPQLSRLVRELEDDLGVQLLDRSSRRQARWTSAALKISEAFDQSERWLAQALSRLTVESQPREVHVACLDGLLRMAVETLGRLVEHSPLAEVHLDVLDLNDLEERLLAGSLDLAWTSRYPGRKKIPMMLELGSQLLVEQRRGSSDTQILSTFEYQSRRGAALGRACFVSNSLVARQIWFESSGGVARFPSEVHSPARRAEVPVLLIGQGSTAEWLWPHVKSAIKSV